MHLFGQARRPLPRPGDPAQAALGLARWREAAADSGDPALVAFAETAYADPRLRELLDCVFGNSPYLTQCLVRDIAFARSLLTEGPDAVLTPIMQGLEAIRRAPGDEGAVMQALRVSKTRLALLTAAADIAGLWPLDRVMQALSDFADAAIGAACAHLLHRTAASGALELANPEAPEVGSGLVVLALGKLGGHELNYSSDVDLIVLFDRERIRTNEPEDLQRRFVRLTRNLVRLLEERTADGYVFRVDLRLRPDPASTPVAISVNAAEVYYESMGQNWERAAMIKARPIAGDLVAGRAFLDRLRPYVWRKNLDFAAIQDIHSIKRQIHAHRGGGTIAVAGHNIKLGRGGIREVEFFVQTQQLIWGGRIPELRVGQTLAGLSTLTATGKTAPEVAADLAEAYRFLRTLEHRLQMMNDEQTQVLPQDRTKRAVLAAFMGFAGLQDFDAAVIRHLKIVETHYAHLFEDAPALSVNDERAGNLVFTGSDCDPETITTLRNLGYENAQAVDHVIRGWHHGRYRAMRSVRARELLTELVPRLLAALASTPQPDHAFLKFDEFLSRLPAGVQLFSMFYANPHLLDLVAEILGEAPRLAEHLSGRASILESVLDGDFFALPPPPEVMDEELDKVLRQADSIEEMLDGCRRWANDGKFQVGVQILRRLITPAQAATALSDIADTALCRLLPRVEAEFMKAHGRFPGAGLAIVALGKLGSQEMTPTSDLDLIMIYTTPPEVSESSGTRPLMPSQYYARLTQRFINALTARTAEGVLYEVDMRLRPSGSKGPIATSFEAFVRYHDELSWTWEHMALSRARVVAGPPDLKDRIEETIREVLCRPRDADRLLLDVADMRMRMDAEHHSDSLWNVKHVRGGLVDVDFIAQYLQLRHAHSHPAVLARDSRTALATLRDHGLLDAAAAAALIDALDLWSAVQMALRTTIEGPLTDEREREISPSLRATLSHLCDAADFEALKDRMRIAADRVHDLFREIVEEPAARLASTRAQEAPT